MWQPQQTQPLQQTSQILQVRAIVFGSFSFMNKSYFSYYYFQLFLLFTFNRKKFVELEENVIISICAGCCTNTAGARIRTSRSLHQSSCLNATVPGYLTSALIWFWFRYVIASSKHCKLISLQEILMQVLSTSLTMFSPSSLNQWQWTAVTRTTRSRWPRVGLVPAAQEPAQPLEPRFVHRETALETVRYLLTRSPVRLPPNGGH